MDCYGFDVDKFCVGHGAKDNAAVKQIRHWTYATDLVTSFIILIGIVLLRNVFPSFFGVSKETGVILYDILPLCAASLPFYAFSRLSSAFFYAIKETKSASVMVYRETFVILPLCVFILPLIFWEFGGLYLLLK